MTSLKYRAFVMLGVITFLTAAILAAGVAQQSAPALGIVQPASAPAAPLHVTVSGFQGGERVQLSLHLTANPAESIPLGDFVVGTDGSLDAQVVLPGGWQPLLSQPEQALSLRATSSDGTSSASIPLTAE